MRKKFLGCALATALSVLGLGNRSILKRGEP